MKSGYMLVFLGVVFTYQMIWLEMYHGGDLFEIKYQILSYISLIVFETL